MKGENTKEVGRRIRAAREAAKMSQKTLAEMVGFKNKTSITHVESGRSDLTLSQISRVADVLDVPPTYLVGWTDIHGNILEEEETIAVSDSLPQEFYSLPQEQQEFVAKMIHSLLEQSIDK